MKDRISSVPPSYGVMRQNQGTSMSDVVIEQVQRIGYAVIDSGCTSSEIRDVSERFDSVRQQYISQWGADGLRRIDEYDTVRMPMCLDAETFLKIALNKTILAVVEKLIAGKFILNQQNCVINPPHQNYNQSAWHRDLPYQHFVSSKPLAINALFCVDAFSKENGASFVLPGSHRSEDFPSDLYVDKNEIQVEAPAGSFLLLDAMLFHRGGLNMTKSPRRAVNHVYTIPYFKQQINIPENVQTTGLSPLESEVLGVSFPEPKSIEEFFRSRERKRGL